MLSFRELQKIVSRRYNLNAALAAEVVDSLLKDDLSGKLLKFRDEDEVYDYLDWLEKAPKD